MSRADRAHLVIKDAIRSSVGDLDKVLYHISAILRRQKEEYQAELARQAASRAAKKLLSPMFRLVAEWVSHHTLFKTDEIVQKLRRLQTEHREKRKGGLSRYKTVFPPPFQLWVPQGYLWLLWTSADFRPMLLESDLHGPAFRLLYQSEREDGRGPLKLWRRQYWAKEREEIWADEDIGPNTVIASQRCIQSLST
ncbi:hypothetical protein BDV29DRAFT_160495 [Aspergillus leporis]|uniref:Uncharacterized protein n=1 Tax=Aspergillus leporis TaxID=41062 RepID=A0A5N5WTJ8_9EURO|nr:hypothetical protein BDV29DRAFT_160495 [Aspergillus leporis]